MYEITTNQIKEFLLSEISIFILVIINLISDFH